MGKLYEEFWYQKWAKIANLGKFPRVYWYKYRAVPVQVQGCTGTAHQRLICTGTGVPKMPRLYSFCIIELKFIFC